MVPLTELLGECSWMVSLRETVTRLLQAPADGRRLPPVFIEGETGTGKSALARAMHRASARRDGPFVAVNCSAIPDTLAEAQLFGHERGAFTDAREARPGLFQQAHRGTIFLDEIVLMPASLQPKLLKVLEDKEVRRVGGTRAEVVDVWVLAASNADIDLARREQRFREDLYQRLALVTLRLPPLRERGTDILLLAEHFLVQACREYGLPPRRLDPEARGALLAYPWPGNVRELANVMERCALFAQTETIGPRALGLPTAPAGDDEDLRAVTPPSEGIDRERILQAWRETNGNLARAARRLGMPRNTLRYRLQQLGELRGTAGSERGREEPASSPRGAAADTPAPADSRRLAVLRVEVTAAAPEHLLASGNWIEAAVDKIDAFGGSILEQSATSLTAAFGLEPTEDAPGRAAYTAIALRRAAERARGEEQTIHVRIAADVRRVQVEAGRVVHDLPARLDVLAASAEPDTIVASEAAAPFLDRRFELALLDAPESARPRVYRIVGLARPGVDPSRRLATFVGRRQDLERLGAHLEEVVHDRGQIVGIVGDAGIGKSRLIAELRRGLAGREVTYLEGACLSYASAIPYVPVLAVLRQACGLAEADAAETIAASLRERLEALDMDVEASAPYLLRLLGLRDGTEGLAQLTSEAIRVRTLDVLRQMILGASAQRPLVLVVEDVHWADKASAEVFASIAAGVPGARVLFVSTYRPGVRPPWMDRSLATQMALSPLSPEDSLTMLRSVLTEEVPETVTRMILDRAEGNPFFIEEIYRAIGEQGHSGEPPAAPATIEEVLLARIERLPRGPQEVLQAAAVLGREFTWRLLETVWRGAGALETHVALLTDLEFLYQRAGGRERALVFKHALTQEVAYGSLAPARRRELHAAAGDALERLFADRREEVYDRLAHHYSRTEDAAKAVEYLSALAARAARSDAHEEAVHAWREALQHVERLAPDARDRRRLEMLMALAGSLLPLGRIAEIGAALLPERERLERLRDPGLAGRYYFVLARMYMLGNHALVVDNARRAIAEAERCGDDATMGGAYGVLAVACVLSGQADRGIECGRRAVTFLERTTNRWALSYAHWAVGLCCSQLGRFEEALAAERQSLAISEAIGDAGLVVSATWAMGIVRVAMGEWDEGVGLCRRAVEAGHDVLYRAIASAFLGFAYTETGDATRAIEALEWSIPLMRRFGLRAYEGWFTAFLAEAHRLAGHLARAEVLAESGDQIASEASFPVAAGWAQLSLGRTALARRDLPAAAERLDRALATFTATQSRYECGRTHMDLACVRRAQGDVAAARRNLEAAHRLFRELDVPRFGERVERLAADWGMALGAPNAS